jgi:hypothetical protein
MRPGGVRGKRTAISPDFLLFAEAPQTFQACREWHPYEYHALENQRLSRCVSLCCA